MEEIFADCEAPPDLQATKAEGRFNTTSIDMSLLPGSLLQTPKRGQQSGEEFRNFSGQRAVFCTLYITESLFAAGSGDRSPEPNRDAGQGPEAANKGWKKARTFFLEKKIDANHSLLQRHF